MSLTTGTKRPGLCVVDWKGTLYTRGDWCACCHGQHWNPGDNYQMFGGLACQMCCEGRCDEGDGLPSFVREAAPGWRER